MGIATYTGGNTASKRDVAAVACSALIALPFISPVVAGPSVNAWQQLTSWLCIALLSILVRATSASRNLSISAWLAAIASFVLALHSPALHLSSCLPAVVAVLVASMATCIGSSLAQSSSRTQTAFARGLLGAGTVSALLGLLQYYGFAEHLEPWTTAPALGQAFGNLRQRNQFASLINMALISALWLYATHCAERTRKRIAWWALVILLVVADAASTSRTGLLELCSVVGVATWIAWRERRPWSGVNTGAARRLPAPAAMLLLIPLYFVAGWMLPQLIGGGVDSG
jgi:hypothetical protein